MAIELDFPSMEIENKLILKDHIKNILDEIYIICRSVGRDCNKCLFENEEKIKWETGYEKDQYIDLCPIDAALIEWKSSIGRGNRIHPWIIKNLDVLPLKLKKLKNSLDE